MPQIMRGWHVLTLSTVLFYGLLRVHVQYRAAGAMPCNNMWLKT